jgi:hypothetical protein
VVQAAPAVTLVLPSPKTFQARPTRGSGRKSAVVEDCVERPEDGWWRTAVDHTVGEGVDACAILRLAPAGRGFAAEAGTDFDARREVEGVFEEGVGEECAPAELGGLGRR